MDWAPVCPQPIKYVGVVKNAPVMDEDCLYLNVFTPEHTSSVSQLFPVMIYIHGGGWHKGDKEPGAEDKAKLLASSSA